MRREPGCAHSSVSMVSSAARARRLLRMTPRTETPAGLLRVRLEGRSRSVQEGEASPTAASRRKRPIRLTDARDHARGPGAAEPVRRASRQSGMPRRPQGQTGYHPTMVTKKTARPKNRPGHIHLCLTLTLRPRSAAVHRSSAGRPPWPPRPRIRSGRPVRPPTRAPASPASPLRYRPPGSGTYPYPPGSGAR